VVRKTVKIEAYFPNGYLFPKITLDHGGGV